MGQVVTFQYGLSSDPYKITQITDPFGRTAVFNYTTDPSGALELKSITDQLGLNSSYQYQTGDFISQLTTPYGTTTFTQVSNPLDSSTTSLLAVDPNGGQEYWENWIDKNPDVPDSEKLLPNGISTQQNQYLAFRNTYYWNTAAIAMDPGHPYTNAYVYHWLHSGNGSDETPVLESEKPALESRIWYTYHNQTNGPTYIGSSDEPFEVARVLDDGSTQLWRYVYNYLGHVTQRTDPIGRTTVYAYDTNNVDLLSVYQDNPSGTSTDPYQVPADLIASFTYYPFHLVNTATDASGQTTTYTYNNFSEIKTVTPPIRAGKGAETTTYTYGQGPGNLGGYLKTITGPQAGAITQMSYDGRARIQSITASDGAVTSFNYDSGDRVTGITFPDSSEEAFQYQNLNLHFSQDRSGYWTEYFHNSVRQLVAVEDPMLGSPRINAAHAVTSKRSGTRRVT